MMNNPKNVRFEDIESLLWDWDLRYGPGGLIIHLGRIKILLWWVKPHGSKKFTAMVDVKKILTYLKEEGYV